MADHVEVAQAYVTIIPSMQGAQETISNELGASAETAGSSAGKKAGANMASEIGSSLSSAGSSLTKSLTVPLAAAGTAAVAAWKQVDNGLDIIAQKTGATGESLEQMGTIMENIATTIPVSFEDAGSAIGEVNTRFGVTGAELEALSTKFLMFANLNGTNVSNAVDMTSKALAAFGMDASEAGNMLDALNVVGQATGVSVDTLASQLSQNAAQFQQMGLSAYDAANFLGQCDMAGLETSTMMMGLKTAMKSAAADGMSLDEVLANFQTTMQGNGSEADKLALAYELFGSRAGGAIYNAVSTGQLSLDSFTGSLTEFGGSVESTFNTTLSPLDRFQQVLNELMILGADIVEAASPIIDSIVATVIPIINSLVEAWNALDPGMQQFIITAALAVAAIGPIISTIGGITTGISTLMSVIGGLNPVVLLIVGAVAAVIAIIENWGAISEWIKGVWDSVINGISNAAQAVGNTISNIWNGIKTVTSVCWEGIKTLVTNVWNTIKNTVSTVINAIKNTISSIWNSIKATTSNVWNSIKSVVTDVWDTLKGAVENAVNAVGTTVSNVWNSISSWTSNAWNTIKGTVIGVWDSIKNAFASAWETMTSVGKNIVEGIWNGISGGFTWIKNKISGWVGDVLGFFKRILGIHSPSKVFEESVGQYIGLGVGEGIEDTIPDVEKSMDKMVASVTPTVSMNGTATVETPKTTAGQIILNVYGAVGQDVNALADIVMERMQFAISKREGAFA